jgi:hypothetical protein
MPDVTTVVATLKSVVDLAKGVKDASVRIELQEKVLEAQGQLIDFQEELAAVRAENRELRDQLDLRRMVVKDGMYYDESGDGPFCPGRVDGKSIRCRVSKNPANGFWVCTVCGKSPPGTNPPGSGGIRTVRIERG